MVVSVRTTSAGQPGRHQPAGLPVVTAGLSRRRQIVAVVLLLVGLPVLTEVLVSQRDDLSYATPVLAVLVLVVAVALVGGLRVALAAALLGGLVLNWFFTPPFGTFAVERSDQLLALVVYLGFAVAVSVIVDTAARRTAEATRARAEARELSSLAGATLAEARTLPDLLERVRTTFGMREVSLLEQAGGTWRPVATVGGGEPEPGEAELRVPAGPDAVLSGLGPPLFAADQRVLAAFAEAAGTALEGRRLAQQAQANAALEAADRMRTALLAAVGHDLRTPLASIKAAVSSLRQDDVEFDDDQRDELLATVETSADRLQALVANLLDASRLQAGAVSVQLQPTALEEVAGRVLLALPPEDRERVTLDIPAELPDVLADPGLLERVLANLLDNAIRHTPVAEVATVRAGPVHDAIECKVVDHGPGVDAAQMTHMFAPFQRLSDRTPAGVGLGLAVARGFTEAMRGSLTPASTPGGGLTMRLTLPRAALAAAGAVVHPEGQR
jgi:two-component system sensor histidine kinase KdpD